ncbi:Uncharacterised protein [Mycoplasmopsis maculosa]|uniref:DUF3137 domain-containing protein n=1 Tax=Mycoplasmopsis maculosa TaxID=114885 RepID=A0A449B3P1_9BACT|nr:hypothetical protein [Mycoplasmopsis maculosa]VEU75212.1 Uncharacterised protein [Mycoplasmopsis maculosa]
MENNLFLSKNQFKEFISKKVNSRVDTAVKGLYSDKKFLSKFWLATIGYWIGLSLLLIGILFFIINISTGIYANFKQNDFFQNNSKIFFSIMYTLMLVFSISGILIFLLSRSAKKNIKNSVINNFEAQSLYSDIFEIFNLERRKDNDNDELNHQNTIRFFKNMNNFKNISNFNLVENKYPIYELSNGKNYFKMGNLEYFNLNWVNKNSLKKSKIRKLVKSGSEIYGNYIQDPKKIKRFGYAFKSEKLSSDMNLIFFDPLNVYSKEDPNYSILDKEYTHLSVKGIANPYVNKWIMDKENLDLINTIYNELNISSVNSIGNKIKNNQIESIGMVVKNSEVYIWFDTPFELLDLKSQAVSLKKEENIKYISEKIIDDFYLIYLIFQLCSPFGFSVKLKNTFNEKNIEKNKNDEEFLFSDQENNEN